MISPAVSLAAETLPMLLSIMNDGLAEACVKDGFIRRSLTCYKGSFLPLPGEGKKKGPAAVSPTA